MKQENRNILKEKFESYLQQVFVRNSLKQLKA